MPGSKGNSNEKTNVDLNRNANCFANRSTGDYLYPDKIWQLGCSKREGNIQIFLRLLGGVHGLLWPFGGQMTPLELFRAGYDYILIAQMKCTTEAVIERVIHKLRYDERIEKHLIDRKDQAAIREQESQRRLNQKMREILWAERAKAAQKETPR